MTLSASEAVSTESSVRLPEEAVSLESSLKNRVESLNLIHSGLPATTAASQGSGLLTTPCQGQLEWATTPAGALDHTWQCRLPPRLRPGTNVHSGGLLRCLICVRVPRNPIGATEHTPGRGAQLDLRRGGALVHCNDTLMAKFALAVDFVIHVLLMTEAVGAHECGL